MKRLVILGLFLAGCGGEVPPEETTGAVSLPSCTDVGAAQNCVYSPGHNGPSPTVTCQSNHNGVVVPVVGCTLDLLAAPGEPYTATCVSVCPAVGAQ